MPNFCLRPMGQRAAWFIRLVYVQTSVASSTVATAARTHAQGSYLWAWFPPPAPNPDPNPTPQLMSIQAAYTPPRLAFTPFGDGVADDVAARCLPSAGAASVRIPAVGVWGRQGAQGKPALASWRGLRHVRACHANTEKRNMVM